MLSDPTDPRWFRQVLGQYPTGVSVVTATPAEGPKAGFVVGSFASVSLDPPLIVFFPDKGSTSWPRIEPVGSFCVNILSHEQEHVCRQFAAKTADKFEGISHHPAPSGSPIIDGVVAWIDCDLESIEEVGDHFAVYGRVRVLDIGASELPLLFFQGGYGSFRPLSLVAADPRGALTEQLRAIDLVRPMMDRLAVQLSTRVIATAPADDHLVVAASAGAGDGPSQATLVGQRLPLMPPASAVFAAWREPAAIDAWLEPLPTEEDRAAQRQRLGAVRERGYSVGLINEAQRRFASTMDRLASDPTAVDHDELRGLLGDLSYDPLDLDEERKRAIRSITVPVFGSDGDIKLALTAYGFPRPSGEHGVDAYIESLLEVGRAATAAIGGSVAG